MILRNGIAYLTSEEMKAADNEAIEEFGIDVLSLMENAGLAVAMLARRLLEGNLASKKIGVLVGKGNNGGDGLVAARHMNNWGAAVVVMLGDRDTLGPAPERQLIGVERAGVPIEKATGSLSGCNLIIDSLLGYNSKGDPREPVRDMILHANASAIPILAVDIPSGLDATSGEPNDPCIVAKATITMGFPKTGFLNPECQRYVGQLYLANVSLPIETYKKFSQTRNVFEEASVVRVK